MADRMGCAVAHAASHRQLYLAASGTDRRHGGGGVNKVARQDVHILRDAFCNQENAAGLRFPHLQKAAKVVPYSHRLLRSSQPDFSVYIGPQFCTCSFTNSHVNDSEKPLVRCTWVFMPSTDYARKTSEK